MKMAFANLFRGLSAVEEHVQSPGQPAFTRRNGTGKRKNQGEQAGLHQKKQCDQAQKTRIYNPTSEDFKAMHNTDTQEHTRAGFREEEESHRTTPGHNNTYHKTKNKHNANKRKQQKNRQQKDGGRPGHRRGSHDTRLTWRKGGWDRNKNYKKDFQVRCARSMTQEFKDQNVLVVDGQLLCRHFLWGRCMKGDDCQMQHVQGHNDLVKEVCKFYVQGLCTKGESCPYMHKSFPCKFFHRKVRCKHGDSCKFSHEPLTELTERLLDEALKRESDLCELSKRAEQESSGQPANTEETIDANRTPDIFLQGLRPNFYKSSDTKAEEEALVCPTEEQVENLKEALPPHASDQPHSPQSNNLSQEEPVCYSVEAVLGPQRSKPFISFFTAPRSQEPAPVSSSDSLNHSQVPYSVDAVLSSYKSVAHSTFSNTYNLPSALTVSYTPKTYSEDITDPLISSEKQNERVSYSADTRNEANKSQGRMFNSLSLPQEHSSLVSKTCPTLTLASGNHKKQDGSKLESLKPAQRASHGDKLELSNLPSQDVSPIASTKPKSIFFHPAGQKSTFKHPAQSLLTADIQASFKPFCPSSGFTEFKGRATAPAETVNIKTASSVGYHFAERQPTDSHLHSKKTQSALKLGTKQPNSTENTAECSSKPLRCGDLAVKKTLEIPFESLFPSPITDTLQPIAGSVTGSSCPQGSVQSSCPAPQSADRRGNHLRTVLAPNRDSAHSFLSLFAAPLSAAPLSAAPLSAAPLSAAPLRAAPLRAAPLSAAPLSAAPLSAAPLSAAPLSAAPLRAAPLRAAPLRAAPLRAAPLSAAPLSAAPLSAAPLSAAPLRAAPVPCSQSEPDYCSQQSVQSADDTSHLSDSKQKTSRVETPLPRLFSSYVKETPQELRSPNSSPDPKVGEDSSSERMSGLVSDSHSETSIGPTVSPCVDGSSTSQADQQLPTCSSHRGSVADSLLKTLFLSLSPYQQDGEQQDSSQISVSSESEKKDKRSTWRVVVSQQETCKEKGRRKKKHETQESLKQSTVRAVAHSTEQSSAPQTPQISTETGGGSTLSSPGMSEPQVRDSATHKLPFKPAALQMKHQTQPRLKRTPEEGTCVNGNVAATPLKDLFRSLDAAVFQFGH